MSGFVYSEVPAREGCATVYVVCMLYVIVIVVGFGKWFMEKCVEIHVVATIGSEKNLHFYLYF